MRLNQPTKIVFYISLALGILGVILSLIGQFDPWNFWLVVVAWVLLVLGVTLKGF